MDFNYNLTVLFIWQDTVHSPILGNKNLKRGIKLSLARMTQLLGVRGSTQKSLPTCSTEMKLVQESSFTFLPLSVTSKYTENKLKSLKRVKEKLSNHPPFHGLKMWFLRTRINAVSVLEPLQEASIKGRHSVLRPLGGDWVPSCEPMLRKRSLEHRGPCEFSFLSGEMNISWGHLTLIRPAHQGYPCGSTCPI